MLRRWAMVLTCLVLLSSCVVGTSGVGMRGDPPSRDPRMEATLQRFRGLGAGVRSAISSAYAYAIFPSVGKGGVGFGGAAGGGKVYQKGRLVGLCSILQGTFGFQLGGQFYSEIVLFRDKWAFERFRSGGFEVAAQASAVLIVIGISTDLSLRKGYRILTTDNVGLMYEASIGAQKFSFSSV